MGIALLVIASTFPPAGPPRLAGAVRSQDVSPAEFVDIVTHGGLDATGVVVGGDVDLRNIRTIDRLLRCRACTIRGSLLAADVVFDRVVDLSGLRVHGDLDAHGATFGDVVTFGDVNGRPSEIDGRTDLSLATFRGLTVFDDMVFSGPVDLSHVTVTSPLSFAEAQFLSGVDSAHARFNDTVTFSNATFVEAAHFDVASFADTTLFRAATFRDDVTFRSADFNGRLDFTLSTFDEAAVFDNVVLEGPGIFRGVNATGRMTWDQSFAQTLDFEDAALTAGASFAGVATSDVLSLDGVTVIPESGLTMGSMNPARLLLHVDLVGQIAGRTVRAEALRLLEETAEEQGNLALANDARFALLATLNEASFGPSHWLDAVFYRGIGGYLVRPLHPVVTLAALVVLAGFARAATRADRPLRLWDTSLWDEGRDGRRRPSSGALRVAGGAVVTGIHDAMRQVLRTPQRAGAASDAETPTLRTVLLAVESGMYKVLLAVTLIALSNSSATLREIIDAVRG